ncbi:MAG: NADH dehydrogenase [Planctomycetes bacterium RIFOXYB12_FULL_42_10]|nr:MAG: NADH dehydrogenase [Planctomycetes bacterium GWB2_41_19]OHB72153.1 MAG: NADH dehydrogenase [Planctomycetes bacterium RBG_16_41_13]OHC11289.1 MAG: NADH dehydrogenase [Planctomycetes bacterium RIFOXYB12_FULL_42_10]
MSIDRQPYLNNIMNRFKANVTVAKGSLENEIYISTNTDNLEDICTYIHKTFQAPLSSMVCNDERSLNKNFTIYYVFSLPDKDLFFIVYVPISEQSPNFPSITPYIPAAHWYEREIKDMFGLEPVGHPDPYTLVLHGNMPENTYPLRKDFHTNTRLPHLESKLPFARVNGEGVFEIPVGPIHAGIIEPGHFRFSAVGDTILYLDAKLFFTHKGTEKLFEAMPYTKALFLAERICGVCAASHATGYCQAIEKVADIEIPPRAKFIRTIILELERLYNHIGDVGNVCVGASFLMCGSHGFRIREYLQQLNETICGNRYLRGMITIGGVRFDINNDLKRHILGLLNRVKTDFKELTEIMSKSSSFLDRVETTGRLSLEHARGLGVVGVPARASGICRDTRINHPYAAYSEVDFDIPVYYDEGDVWARIKVRIDEVYQSISIIEQCFHKMPEGSLKTSTKELPPYKQALSYVESPRGEDIYWIMTAPNNMLFRYKVRSPSFCNWPSIPYTIPGNIVPDFPLINKSFELCYSCTDL